MFVSKFVRSLVLSLIVVAAGLTSVSAMAAAVRTQSDEEMAQVKSLKAFISQDIVVNTVAKDNVCGNRGQGFESKIYLKNSVGRLTPIRVIGVTQSALEQLFGLTGNVADCQ
jgi:hypothetical protein